MPANQVKLTGKVVMGKISVGSKSEHKAVRLLTDNGSFVLRRKGGNPFFDSFLQNLAGKVITATGTIKDYVFMASEVKEAGSSSAA